MVYLGESAGEDMAAVNGTDVTDRTDRTDRQGNGRSPTPKRVDPLSKADALTVSVVIAFLGVQHAGIILLMRERP